MQNRPSVPYLSYGRSFAKGIGAEHAGRLAPRERTCWARVTVRDGRAGSIPARCPKMMAKVDGVLKRWQVFFQSRDSNVPSFGRESVRIRFSSSNHPTYSSCAMLANVHPSDDSIESNPPLGSSADCNVCGLMRRSHLRVSSVVVDYASSAVRPTRRHRRGEPLLPKKRERAARRDSERYCEVATKINRAPGRDRIEPGAHNPVGLVGRRHQRKNRPSR
jgi:hypothetical protein